MKADRIVLQTEETSFQSSYMTVDEFSQNDLDVMKQIDPAYPVSSSIPMQALNGGEYFFGIQPTGGDLNNPEYGQCWLPCYAPTGGPLRTFSVQTGVTTV